MEGASHDHDHQREEEEREREKSQPVCSDGVRREIEARVNLRNLLNKDNGWANLSRARVLRNTAQTRGGGTTKTSS